MKYVIEMKYKKSAIIAILKLMGYIVADIVPLRNAIERDIDFYLIGININTTDAQNEGEEMWTGSVSRIEESSGFRLLMLEVERRIRQKISEL